MQFHLKKFLRKKEELLTLVVANGGQLLHVRFPSVQICKH